MGKSDFSKERVNKVFSVLDEIRNINRELAVSKESKKDINNNHLKRKNLLWKLKIMLEK
jgi:hypothetical protein